MTVYDIPNIEHCTVTERLNGQMFQITTHEGWYIHLNNGIEGGENLWKTVVILRADSDFSIVEIRAFEDLPPEAEICGTVTDTETM